MKETLYIFTFCFSRFNQSQDPGGDFVPTRGEDETVDTMVKKKKTIFYTMLKNHNKRQKKTKKTIEEIKTLISGLP